MGCTQTLSSPSNVSKAFIPSPKSACDFPFSLVTAVSKFFIGCRKEGKSDEALADKCISTSNHWNICNSQCWAQQCAIGRSLTFRHTSEKTQNHKQQQTPSHCKMCSQQVNAVYISISLSQTITQQASNIASPTSISTYRFNHACVCTYKHILDASKTSTISTHILLLVDANARPSTPTITDNRTNPATHTRRRVRELCIGYG